MITVRLDSDTRTTLERLAARRGQSKSDVIRDAISRLAEVEEQDGGNAYERMSPFVGVVDSGGQQLSTQTGRSFRRLLEADSRARRPG